MPNQKTKFYKFLEKNKIEAMQIHKKSMVLRNTIGYRALMAFKHGYNDPNMKTVKKVSAALTAIMGREVFIHELI